MLYTLIAIFILLSPVFSNYVLLGGLSFGDLLIISSVLLGLFALRPTPFFLWSIFLASSIIVASFIVLFFNEIISLSFFRASFFLIAPCVLLSLRPQFYDVLFRCYLAVSTFFVLALIAQVATFYVSGLTFPLQLPLEVYETDTLYLVDLQTQGFRTGGFFKEPSYFAIYILPALLFFPLAGKIKKHSMFVLSSVLSTSSLGIASSIVSLYFYSVTKDYRTKILKISLFMFFVVIFVSLLFVLKDVPWISRFFDIFIDGGTLNARFFPIFDSMTVSGTGLVEPELNERVLSSDGLTNWYSSFIYLLSNFGWLFVLPFALFLHRIGFVGGVFVFLIIIFTHAFTTAYFTCFIVVFYAIYLQRKKHADDEFNNLQVKLHN